MTQPWSKVALPLGAALHHRRHQRDQQRPGEEDVGIEDRHPQGGRLDVHERQQRIVEQQAAEHEEAGEARGARALGLHRAPASRSFTWATSSRVEKGLVTKRSAPSALPFSTSTSRPRAVSITILTFPPAGPWRMRWQTS